MAGENVPVHFLQGGSVLEVAAGGTILVAGSMQFASGGALNLASGAALSVPNLTLGGTVFRAAYGTAALTSGVGTIATGLTRAFSGGASIVGRPGAGSAYYTTLDMSLSGAGSIILYAGSSVGSFTGDSTVAWYAFGT